MKFKVDEGTNIYPITHAFHFCFNGKLIAWRKRQLCIVIPLMRMHKLVYWNPINLLCFPSAHSILTMSINTSFYLSCHHLLMRIINIIMCDRMDVEPGASLRDALRTLNVGMLIIPAYSISQTIYYYLGDVTLKSEQMVVILCVGNGCLLYEAIVICHWKPWHHFHS